MKWLFATVFILLACQAMGNIKRETKAHNKYRALHGVANMKWDAEVAGFAQDWCDFLAANDKFEHSKDSGYGENLYKAMGTDSATKAGCKAVKAWYDEIKDYDYNNPVFSSATGHFTQVVWANSKKFGCGVATKETSTWVCCNYDPPGNYAGQFEDNVPPLVEEDSQEEED